MFPQLILPVSTSSSVAVFSKTHKTYVQIKSVWWLTFLQPKQIRGIPAKRFSAFLRQRQLMTPRFFPVFSLRSTSALNELKRGHFLHHRGPAHADVTAAGEGYVEVCVAPEICSDIWMAWLLHSRSRVQIQSKVRALGRRGGARALQGHIL